MRSGSANRNAVAQLSATVGWVDHLPERESLKTESAVNINAPLKRRMSEFGHAAHRGEIGSTLRLTRHSKSSENMERDSLQH